MQKDFILSTLTATYQHPSLGLRYLFANLKEFQERCVIKEYTIKQNPLWIAESLLAHSPKVIGFGVYIWNREQTQAVVEIIKKVCPQIKLILGGPEVSFETSLYSPLVEFADFVIGGEADLAFYDLLARLERGEADVPKLSKAPLPEIGSINLPYSTYTDEDILNRNIYVEASRGCPFKCEYCLSSLDLKVRNFALDGFLAELDRLIERGATNFKFIDRTFNLSPPTCQAILKFFLQHLDKNLFLHFEMVPDRLPEDLKPLLSQFPKGSLQFEIGIQTLNPQVAKNVSRRTDLIKAEANIRYLRESSPVHMHADLIVGLPGEDFASFGRGFDLLYSWGPHEIQVGILKKLKGTPIVRHDDQFKMQYCETQPYQILQTADMSFAEINLLVRFAKYWDLFANSGRFTHFMQQLQSVQLSHFEGSLFFCFLDFSQFVFAKTQETHSISFENQMRLAFEYLTQHCDIAVEVARTELSKDYLQVQPKRLPRFLATTGVHSTNTEGIQTRNLSLRRRQDAHAQTNRA